MKQADPDRPVLVGGDVSLALFWRPAFSHAAILDAASSPPADPALLACTTLEAYVPPSCSGVTAAGHQGCTYRRAPEIPQPVEHRSRGLAFEVPLRDAPPPAARYDLSGQGGRGFFALAALRAFVDEDKDGALRYGTPAAAPEAVVADSAYRDYPAADGQRRSYLIAFLDGTIAVDRAPAQLADVLRSMPQGFSVWIEDEWTDRYGRPFVFARRTAATDEPIELVAALDTQLAAPWCGELTEDQRYVSAIPVDHAPLWCSDDGKRGTWRWSRRTSRCTYETLIYEGDTSCTPVAVSPYCPTQIDGLVKASVATIGMYPNPMYTFSVDGGAPVPASTVGGATLGVAAGAHAVTLGGIPANCSVAGENPVAVTVARGGRATALFEVRCVSTTRLRITTVTTGASLDDAYLLTGPSLSAAIGANTSILLDLGAVQQGLYALTLGDVAWNCTAADRPGQDREVWVWLTPGQESELLIPVQCVGVARIRLTTTRSGTPPDWYTFSFELSAVDAPWDLGTWRYPGLGSQPVIFGDGSSPSQRLPAGTYRARLADFPPNCSVSPADVTFSVGGDQTADVAFDIACRAWELRVTTVTTGPDIDDHYIVEAARQWPWTPAVVSSTVGSNDSVRLETGTGRFFVVLADVAWNCAAIPIDYLRSYPYTGRYAVADVTVWGADLDLTLPVQCTAAGRIRVTTSTSGEVPDPDGYGVVLSGGSGLHVGPWTQAVPATGSVVVGEGTPGETLPTGVYTARLDGVARNCDALPAEATFEVVRGQTADISFSVQCSPPGAVRVTTPTSGPDPDPDGFQFQLTRTDAPGGTDSIPIATNGTSTIQGLHAGTYRGRLAGVAPNCRATEVVVNVAWGQTADAVVDVACEPDTQIAYTSVAHDFCDPADPFTWGCPLPAEIHVVNSNGTGARNLTQHPANDIEPAWSPDGRIAFASDREGAYEIFVMNADGSSVARLSTGGGRQPAWSPDGSRLAFVSDRDGSGQIYVMNADGSNPVRLTSDPLAAASDPAWSPDGTRIAFVRAGAGWPDGSHIYAMNARGGEISWLTAGVVYDYPIAGAHEIEPAWSPDGSRLAFTRRYWDTESVVYELDLVSGLATLRFRGSHASWTPDGRAIAYVDFWGAWCGWWDCRGLFVTGADASPYSISSNVLSDGADLTQPAWRPAPVSGP